MASNACHQSGYKTAPVLSVAKKLAALRPTPTAPAANCGLIRQDEADWLWLSIGCRKTFAMLLFSFLLEVITGQGELTECSKRTCFSKNCSTWFLGAVVSEIDDRCRQLSGIVGVIVMSKASWGREKNRPNATYPNSKEEEKAILNARIQIHERVREPNWGWRSIDELLCACMHALRAAAVHVLFSQ